eukprot:6181220-Pleurochrysis_carterae.AAC.1
MRVRMFFRVDVRERANAQPLARHKQESLKQRKIVYQLEKDREKHGAEASDGNAKFLAALEEVSPTLLNRFGWALFGEAELYSLIFKLFAKVFIGLLSAERSILELLLNV